MSKIVNEIGSAPIGGKLKDSDNGMTIDEIVNSLYRLSEDLQCPVYFGDGPTDTTKIPSGALRVNISKD